MTIQSLQTQSQTFTIAAFDHRSSLANMLGIDTSSELGVSQMKKLKVLFMKVFSPLCSAVLVDPIYGIDSLENKSDNTGLLMSLEQSGYEGGKEVVPPLVETFGLNGCEKYKAAAKLLLYFHPQEDNARKKIQLVENLYYQAQNEDIAFLLEPVVFMPTSLQDQPRILEHLIQTVKTFTDTCDVLKIEYPGLFDTDEQKACRKVSNIATVPWILLSRGMEYKKFKHSLQVAMQHGAQGFAVGRAVWQEIEKFGVQHTNDWNTSVHEIETFLHETGVQRMKELIEVVGE